MARSVQGGRGRGSRQAARRGARAPGESPEGAPAAPTTAAEQTGGQEREQQQQVQNQQQQQPQHQDVEDEEQEEEEQQMLGVAQGPSAPHPRQGAHTRQQGPTPLVDITNMPLSVVSQTGPPGTLPLPAEQSLQRPEKALKMPDNPVARARPGPNAAAAGRRLGAVAAKGLCRGPTAQAEAAGSSLSLGPRRGLSVVRARGGGEDLGAKESEGEEGCESGEGEGEFEKEGGGSEEPGQGWQAMGSARFARGGSEAESARLGDLTGAEVTACGKQGSSRRGAAQSLQEEGQPQQEKGLGLGLGLGLALAPVSFPDPSPSPTSASAPAPPPLVPQSGSEGRRKRRRQVSGDVPAGVRPVETASAAIEESASAARRGKRRGRPQPGTKPRTRRRANSQESPEQAAPPPPLHPQPQQQQQIPGPEAIPPLPGSTRREQIARTPLVAGLRQDRAAVAVARQQQEEPGKGGLGLGWAKACRRGPLQLGVINIDNLSDDPQACATYAADIYRHLRLSELRRRPDSTSLTAKQSEVTATMRAILVDWLVEVAEQYRLVPDTLYLTVNYIDRYLALWPVARSRLQLLGVTCMLIASKYEEIYAPQVDEFCYITDNTYRREEVLEMERTVLNALHFQLSFPTVKTFLRRFNRAAQADFATPSLQMEFMGNFLAEMTLVDFDALCFLPSLIAASSVFLARVTLWPNKMSWSSTLEHYSGYKAKDLQECTCYILRLQRTRNPQLPAIRDKYRQVQFQSVSTIAPIAEAQLLDAISRASD